MATTKLAHQTQKAAGIGNGLRAGVVSAVSSAGITLNINGAQVGPFACLGTLMPNVGDTVSVFRQDAAWVILGRPNPVPAQFFPVNIDVVAGGSGLQTSGPQSYPVAFPAGANLMGFTNLQSANANARHWYGQWVNTSNSQYEIILTNTTGTSPDARTLAFNVAVFIV